MKHRDLLLRLELRSNPELLCAVRGAIERLTEKMGFLEPECRSVTRAIDEAMTNIIRHAYGDQRDQSIELTCYLARRVADGAGHPPAMIVRKGESPRLLESRSMVLGLFEDAVDSDPTIETAVQAGDRVIIYTDGLTENFNSRHEMLGIDGLTDCPRRFQLAPDRNEAANPQSRRGLARGPRCR